MKPAIVRWRELGQTERTRLLRRSEESIDAAEKLVRPVIEDVRNRGDAALVDYTLRFDKADISGLPLRVSDAEFETAEQLLDPRVREALDYAVENVRRFHTSQRPAPMSLHEIRPGVFVGERATPIDSVGLYVPRGRGSFPSMLYMLAVPAVIAGVPRIAVATPPGPDGRVDPACLVAARLAGIGTVYRMGGSHAVAALAYGTQSVDPVYKLVGPGSAYVAAAKRLLHEAFDVGPPAGPSESMIIADGGEDHLTVARDLLIEAEHGEDSSAVLVCLREDFAARTAAAVEESVEATVEPRRGFLRGVFSNYGAILIASDRDEAADIANAFAPEHLQLRTSDPFAMLGSIRNAGEILLGAWSPFSLANYAAGANAVLPTGGRARTFSAVSVREFIKYSSVVHVTEQGYPELARTARVLADYEGFPSHAAALTDERG